MDNIDRIVAALRTENQRLRDNLAKVQRAIVMLQAITSNGNLIRTRQLGQMSTSGRRRIAAAQKARWAKWKKAKH
jgi:hypothetical protein